MSRLLLVDDEANVLNALRRELADTYDLETYTSPAEALQHCSETAYDLVIADYKMPEMNGVDFLKQFGELQPDAARMLLSGEADIDALLRLINETHIYRFLAKPWDKPELLANIEQALAYREVVRRRRHSGSPGASGVPGPKSVYEVLLVDGDPYSLGIMSRGLADGRGNEFLFEAMRHELQPQASSVSRGCKFSVHTCVTGTSALEHAKQNPCNLVIVAQKLPDMDGIKLLGELRHLRSEAARILTSESPDMRFLTQAINEVGVDSVLSLYWSTNELKSDARRQMWNIYKLRTTVMQALAAHGLMEGGQVAAVARV